MNELTKAEPREPSTGELLAAVVQQGITPASVEVMERLCALRRDETALANKAAFNRAFFALKKEISGMDFYCDKEAKTKGGAVAYTYCSETEISAKLEPVMFRHGFAMLFGQRQDAGRVVAIVTLIHESGHEENREYSVRVGESNQMKDATAVDAGSTTSAWRHLVIKMFGLKSRIRDEGDARNVGECIPQEKAVELSTRVQKCGANPAKFLAFAQAESFETIGANRLAELEKLLASKEKAKPKTDTALAKENLFT